MISKIKNGFKIIYDYIYFITELDPLTLITTFCRFFCYGMIVINLKQRDYVLAVFCIISSFINLALSIMRFNLFYNKKSKLYKAEEKRRIKTVNKNFKKRVYESKMIELEDLRKDEQILIMEEFIQNLKDLQEEAEQELLKLKGEDN